MKYWTNSLDVMVCGVPGMADICNSCIVTVVVILGDSNWNDDADAAMNRIEIAHLSFAWQ